MFVTTFCPGSGRGCLYCGTPFFEQSGGCSRAEPTTQAASLSLQGYFRRGCDGVNVLFDVSYCFVERN